MQFADPKNDLAFKKIFKDERHKEILISFLNAILNFQDGRVIAEVSLIDPYQVLKIPELKETILDIQATNKSGESFIIEIQKKDLDDFTKRSFYYTSKAYAPQLSRENDYSELKKVYFIGILNFNMFTNESYVSRHLIASQETNTQELDDFEFTFIELSKFTKELEALYSILDKWVYFLKNAEDLTMIPIQYQDMQEFKEAFAIATQATWDEHELEVYDYMKLKEFDAINALRTAERKGFKKGFEEGKAQISIAKNLLDILDDETIAKKTGLSVDTVNNLRIKIES